MIISNWYKHFGPQDLYKIKFIVVRVNYLVIVTCNLYNQYVTYIISQQVTTK